MKSIDIKSKKYPDTIIKVSDEDYDVVIAQRWYVSMKPNGDKRIIATVRDGFERKTVQLLHYIHQRRLGRKVQGQLMQKDGDCLNFTRKNVVKFKEETVLKFLIKREIMEDKFTDDQNGNDYCSGLYANMRLREHW